MSAPVEPYHHKTEPTIYAYRQGCRCVGCKAKNAAAGRKGVARRTAKRQATKAAPAPAELVGPVEQSVLDKFEGLADIPWQETWKLLALQHARTMDTVAVSGQLHLAGTAHAKLTECLDRLRPATPPAAQAVKQGISDLESFANDL